MRRLASAREGIDRTRDRRDICRSAKLQRVGALPLLTLEELWPLLSSGTSQPRGDARGQEPVRIRKRKAHAAVTVTEVGPMDSCYRGTVRHAYIVILRLI